jgi:flavin reductase (DIM6/NTAB) family NADH-FMN oxidoreductase RutF
LTVSAFASVSPKPPLIAVIIDHRHKAHGLLQEEGATFAVNILQASQEDLSNRFAWTKDENRFALGNWGTSATGAPILKDALAWMDCRIHSHQAAGSHTIYVGEVLASDVPRPDEAPLVYWNRGYRHLALKNESRPGK